MYMQVLPIVFRDLDTPLLILNIISTSTNFPKTVLVSATREGYFLKRPTKAKLERIKGFLEIKWMKEESPRAQFSKTKIV